ncbi:MBL fold metallo-hydrolase [Pseudonocardia sp. CA-107938]|uniref:MBL fold metallo-hydrolase n=1 Tax=Pseudonocardia sp. CA-107938 TaxID=3240021 RepID=UPI003D8CACBE
MPGTTHPDSIAGIRRWTIGEATVTRVLELPPLVADPQRFLATDRATIRRHDWLQPEFADAEGNIVLHFQAFVIEADGRRILVDPCIGNAKPRTPASMNMLDGPFLEHLAAAGYPRASIDHVLCTHLHTDHCGWNTMLVDGTWVPTFPQARYLFVGSEYEYLRHDDRGDAPAVLADSVRPVVDAGLVTIVGPDHVVTESVRLLPTPGHTPGHSSILIASGGREAIISGDALHHPVQLAAPAIGDHFSWDAELAGTTRRELLADVAQRQALLLGSHFAGPTGVFLEPVGDAWRAVPGPGWARGAP